MSICRPCKSGPDTNTFAGVNVYKIKTWTYKMTPFRNFSKNPTWRHRLRRGTLYAAVAVVLGTQVGCGSENGNDWEEVTTYEVTKGVVTTIEETAPGQFSIVDEQVVTQKDSSKVIIKRLNGTTETLTLAQAKGLIQSQDTTLQTTNYRYHQRGLGHVLWWGAMGYMMGRNFGTPVQSYVYRDDRAGGSTGFYAGDQASRELRRTAIPRTELRPVKGRSGFFRNSLRGRSGG